MNKKNEVIISSAYARCHAFFCSPSPLWMGALIFLILKISFLKQIPPNDYWWYVQLGQDILQNRTLPLVDTYTYTQLGKPIIYNAWLSSVLFRLLLDPTLVTLLHGSLLVMFYGLIWKSCRIVGAGIRLTMLITLLVAMAGTWHWEMRPQLFSFPLFALALFSLLKWQQGETGWVWSLPLISLLWVNLHGAFPLLFLLAGAALLDREGERKTLMYSLLCAFVASLFNPHGVVAWQFVYTILIDNSTQILGPEWQPPTVKTAWQFKLFFFLLLVFPIIITLSPRKLSLTSWIWFLGFAWMALSGARYTVWFLTIFAPINAFLLTPLANQTIDRRATLGKPALNVIIFFLFLLVPLLYLPGVREHWQTVPSGKYTSNTPIKATLWLKSHPEISGNLWADLAMSVYMIYAIPERPVWIDTRTNLYSLEQWNDYLAIANAMSNWETLLTRDDIKLLLLDSEKQPRLIQVLKDSPHWHSPYQDEHSIIYTLNHQPGIP